MHQSITSPQFQVLSGSNFSLYATRQHAFLSTRITFYDIIAQACTEIKILSNF